MESLLIIVLLIGATCCFPAYHEYQSDPALGYVNPAYNNYWSTGRVVVSSDPSSGGYQSPAGGHQASYDDAAQTYETLAAPTEDLGPDPSEPEEPVFSDVSNMEPVYSFKSRSRYQKGRAVFAETTYIPAAPPAPLQAQKYAAF